MVAEMNVSRRAFGSAVFSTTALVVTCSGRRDASADDDGAPPNCSAGRNAEAESAYQRLSQRQPTLDELRQHESNMRAAIEAAKANPGLPFGAVIVNQLDNRPMATGVNSGWMNPTLHGEIAAINNYVGENGNGGWDETTLYSTGEPCAMCMAAIAWVGIPRVVWASSVAAIRNSGIAQIELSAVDVAARSHELYEPEYCFGGVLSHETDAMFASRVR